ncbi:MAG: rhodanese-like domain-containing protein [Rickettsiaceae bacterium]|nr:rhodanese-like domain-containing protein [Rickettsiaceae bacterium]
MTTLHNIDKTEIDEWLKAGNQVIFIDVREVHEFQAGHIKDAVNFLLSEIAINPKPLLEYLQDYTKEKVVLYCQAGVRSVYAAKRVFATNTYQYDLWNLLGGMSAW